MGDFSFVRCCMFYCGLSEYNNLARYVNIHVISKRLSGDSIFLLLCGFVWNRSVFVSDYMENTWQIKYLDDVIGPMPSFVHTQKKKFLFKFELGKLCCPIETVLISSVYRKGLAEGEEVKLFVW